MPDLPPKVRFDYIKSPQFRVVHVDGAYGGITPRGQLFISLYSERLPIPTAIVHQLNPNGQLGDEILSERETRKGVVREVEIGLQFDIRGCQVFHELASNQVRGVR
jgi:hypothetical protein